MGVLSEKYRFVFIHVPKTGGTSLTQMLYENGEEFNLIPGLPEFLVQRDPYYYFNKFGFAHAPADAVRDFLGPEKWADFYSFTVIRNPWDRFVSAYSYLSQDSQGARYNVLKHMSFSDFCRCLCQSLPKGISHLYLDAHDNIIVDDIYRLEDMARDFETLQILCNLPRITAMPHDNKSKRQDYRSYYSDVDAELVAKTCQSEIEIGKYSF